jgi:hypothetical protein
MCAIGPWSLNPNSTSLRIAPAASLDGDNSAFVIFVVAADLPLPFSFTK